MGYEDGLYDGNYSDKRRVRKAFAGGEHVPNKNEAKLLRKLMAETKLSEEEIRSIKKYRIMLSEAQDKGEKPTKTDKEKHKERIMKSVTKKLKLAKEHPLVIEEFNKEWKLRYPNG